MRCARSLLFVASFVACVGAAADLLAQVGYYRQYSSYSYPGFNNRYHGYWRDLGYGFTPRPVFRESYYSEGYWGGPQYPSYAYPSYPSYAYPSYPSYAYPSYYGGYRGPAGFRHRW